MGSRARGTLVKSEPVDNRDDAVAQQVLRNFIEKAYPKMLKNPELVVDYRKSTGKPISQKEFDDWYWGRIPKSDIVEKHLTLEDFALTIATMYMKSKTGSWKRSEIGCHEEWRHIRMTKQADNVFVFALMR